MQAIALDTFHRNQAQFEFSIHKLMCKHDVTRVLQMLRDLAEAVIYRIHKLTIRRRVYEFKKMRPRLYVTRAKNDVYTARRHMEVATSYARVLYHDDYTGTACLIDREDLDHEGNLCAAWLCIDAVCKGLMERGHAMIQLMDWARENTRCEHEEITVHAESIHGCIQSVTDLLFETRRRLCSPIISSTFIACTLAHHKDVLYTLRRVIRAAHVVTVNRKNLGEQDGAS
eukprot:gene101-150_t